MTFVVKVCRGYKPSSNSRPLVCLCKKMTTPTDAKETTSLSASPVVVTNEEEDEEQDPVLDTQWLQRKENKWHSLSGFPQFLELQLNSFVACMERFHTDQMRVAKSPWRHLRQKYPRHFIPKWLGACRPQAPCYL